MGNKSLSGRMSQQEQQGNCYKWTGDVGVALPYDILKCYVNNQN